MIKLHDLVGKRVVTYDGHTGIVIKHFKPTGRNMTVHIRENDGRIWHCPDYDIRKVENEIQEENQEIFQYWKNIRRKFGC